MGSLKIINSALYIITYLSVVFLSKQEELTAAICSLILLYLCIKSPHKVTATALITGSVLSIALYILCISNYAVITFKYSKYSLVPLWLPVAWCLVAFFIQDAAIFIKAM